MILFSGFYRLFNLRLLRYYVVHKFKVCNIIVRYFIVIIYVYYLGASFTTTFLRLGTFPAYV